MFQLPAAEFLCNCNLICGGESGTFPGVIIRFSYAELEQATGKFSDEHLIGVGGSSKVYRGQLGDGKVVAVKKLRPLGGADEDFEFLSEVRNTADTKLKQQSCQPLQFLSHFLTCDNA